MKVRLRQDCICQTNKTFPYFRFANSEISILFQSYYVTEDILTAVI